jgi:hypothetical protein
MFAGRERRGSAGVWGVVTARQSLSLEATASGSFQSVADAKAAAGKKI